MTIEVYLPLASLVISMVALIFSAWVYRSNRHAMNVNQTYKFLDEWREPGFFDSYLFLINTNFNRDRSKDEMRQGLGCLNEDEIVHFRKVSHFMDYLGRAVQNKMLHNKVLFSTIAGSIDDLWQIMGPIIESERTIRAERMSAQRAQYYQAGFENAAELARRFLKKGVYLKALRYQGELTRL